MRKLWRWFFLGGIGFFYLLPPRDTDLGWHLRYGQHLLETGSVWQENRLSFLLPGYHWPQAYTLYQGATYLLYSQGGLLALSLALALLMAAVFYFIFRFFSPAVFWPALASFFLICLSYPVVNLGWRSQLFSLLGVSFLYWWLIKSRKKFLFLPLIFALWANFHGGFVLGLVMIYFYLLDCLRERRKETTKIALTAALSSFAPLINPFGPRLYQEIFRHSWYPLGKLIAEWTPPGRFGLFFLFLGLSFLGVSLLRKEFRPQKNHLFWFLSAIFFTLLSFKARRHLPFFGLFLVFFWGSTGLIKIKTSLAFRSLAVFLFFLLIFWRAKHLFLIKNWSDFCQVFPARAPCRAVSYLKKEPGRCQKIFNAYEWGGFLAWQLPRRKIFVDGRMPAWPTSSGESPYTIYLKIIQARPGWEKKLDSYGADCLLIAKGTFLDLELKKNKERGWRLLYQGNPGVIYQRR